MTYQIITANALTSGDVVYLADCGCWVDQLAQAQAIHTPQDLDTAMATAQIDQDNNIILDPYAIVIKSSDGDPRPVRMKERIRAMGPTNRPDLGKQAMFISQSIKNGGQHVSI